MTIANHEGQPTEEGADNRLVEASDGYSRRVTASERKVGSGLVSWIKTVGAAGAMSAGELIPIFPGYSIADAIGVVIGIANIVGGVANKELDPEARTKKIGKGVVQVVASALPMVPAAAVVPMMEKILPDPPKTINVPPSRE